MDFRTIELDFVTNFDPDQPRDKSGRWTTTGSSLPDLGKEGKHSPEVGKKLVKFLEKETGSKYKLHGSVSKGKTSENDWDISMIPPTQQELEEQERIGREAEEKIWARVSKGELTEAQAMDELYGDYDDPRSLDNVLGRLGFKPTKLMNWDGIQVVSYNNPQTKHNIEIWTPGQDRHYVEDLTGNIDFTTNEDNCGIGSDGFKQGNTCAKGSDSVNMIRKLRDSGVTDPMKIARELYKKPHRISMSGMAVQEILDSLDKPTPKKTPKPRPSKAPTRKTSTESVGVEKGEDHEVIVRNPTEVTSKFRQSLESAVQKNLGSDFKVSVQTYRASGNKIHSFLIKNPKGSFASSVIYEEKGSDGTYAMKFQLHDTEVHDSEKGQGIGSNMTKSLIESYKKMGVSNVPIHLNTNPKYWDKMKKRYKGMLVNSNNEIDFVTNEEGIWRTTDEGQKIFIKDGVAYGGGPNGPKLKNQESIDFQPSDSPEFVETSPSKESSVEKSQVKLSYTQEEAEVAYKEMYDNYIQKSKEKKDFLDSLPSYDRETNPEEYRRRSVLSGEREIEISNLVMELEKIANVVHAENQEEYITAYENYKKVAQKLQEADLEKVKFIAEKEGKADWWKSFYKPEHVSPENQEEFIRISNKQDELRDESNRLMYQVVSSYYGEPQSLSSQNKELPNETNIPSKALRGSSSGKDEKVTQFIQESEVLMQISDRAFKRVVSSGEVKNKFDTGAVGSIGKSKDYAEKRKDTENKLFEIPLDADSKDRPKYGYVEHPDRAKSQGASMKQYGEVQLVFRDSIKGSSTYTIGDSLDDRQRFGSHAYSMADPSAVDLSYTHKEGYNGLSKSITVGRSTKEWSAVYKEDNHKTNVPYIEAQLFGKITLNDIKEVRIPNKVEVSANTQKKLDKAGVKLVRIPDPHKRFYGIIPEPQNAFNPEEDE